MIPQLQLSVSVFREKVTRQARMPVLDELSRARNRRARAKRTKRDRSKRARLQ